MRPYRDGHYKLTTAQRRPTPAHLATGALCVAALLVGCAGPSDVELPDPQFQTSGVIEGFYGAPWSHQDRIDILQFMGRVGLQAYVYAPKNDPFHRTQWREPYPDDERERLRTLVSAADAAGVEFWYALSPGLSMVYSSADDYDALLRKIDQVAALGVTRFGLFVDDVPVSLTHDADRSAFPTLAAAHVDLTNKLHAALTTRGHVLALTPTTYSGAWGDLEYVREIGEGIVPDVGIFWTGNDVASSTITKQHADEWGRLVQRMPLVWDNYPVNDFARWRLFLGPYAGRTADLPAAAMGIIANPMNEAHASMLPLATLADYVRDPASYDPNRSHAAALDSLYGSDARLLQPFLNVFGDYAWDANVLEPLYFLRDTIALGPIERALDSLQSALVAIRQRGAAGSAALALLADEFEPFVAGNRRRVDFLRAQPTNAQRGDTLVYRKNLDRYVADPVTEPMEIDGELLEWIGSRWVPLFRSLNQTGTSEIALRTDSVFLYIAFEVRAGEQRVLEGTRVGEGDHVAIIIDADPTGYLIEPNDVYMLFAPPTTSVPQDPLITSLRFEGFMAKWLADNQALTFTDFHVSTFGEQPTGDGAAMAEGVAYAAVPTNSGYVAELRVPHLGRDRLRLSLTVTTTTPRKRVSSLSRRNYPANPVTYAEIAVGR